MLKNKKTHRRIPTIILYEFDEASVDFQFCKLYWTILLTRFGGYIYLHVEEIETLLSFWNNIYLDMLIS